MGGKVKIASDWYKKLHEEFDKPYFSALTAFVREAYHTKRVYPAGKHIFRAFDACPFDQLKVVILGQDPYHGLGQAEGLCFSVTQGVPMPPSLINIFKELERDVKKPMPTHGSLLAWAAQGVLLLNATLTVEARKAGSHQNQGWEIFTQAAINIINKEKEEVVFILWGKNAGKMIEIIDQKRHLVLTSAHPSPFSAHRGFFGNSHFSKTNLYLSSHGKTPIRW
ncbi:MAG: uracil-DNA glycosylase [Cytophagales bacterium]